jgi:hypothetical protein
MPHRSPIVKLTVCSQSAYTAFKRTKSWRHRQTDIPATPTAICICLIFFCLALFVEERRTSLRLSIFTRDLRYAIALCTHVIRIKSIIPGRSIADIWRDCIRAAGCTMFPLGFGPRLVTFQLICLSPGRDVTRMFIGCTLRMQHIWKIRFEVLPFVRKLTAAVAQQGSDLGQCFGVIVRLALELYV